MPGIDGTTFLGQLRGRGHLLVVVVSSAASAGSSQAADAMTRGAYACSDGARMRSDSGNFIRLLRAAAKAGNTRLTEPIQTGRPPKTLPRNFRYEHRSESVRSYRPIAVRLLMNGRDAMGRFDKHVGLHAGMIQADRLQLNLVAVIRFWSGGTVACGLINVSRFGCRLQVSDLLVPDQSVWLEVEGCEPLLARVIWSEQGFVGCQFEMPLGEVTYSEIISASPEPDILGDKVYI